MSQEQVAGLAASQSCRALDGSQGVAQRQLRGLVFILVVEFLAIGVRELLQMADLQRGGDGTADDLSPCVHKPVGGKLFSHCDKRSSPYTKSLAIPEPVKSLHCRANGRKISQAYGMFNC
ncbi:hypothetical protein HX836_16405 [Pseudomonas yamanorum]|nr:hypothetical protein [Pseudomonas yamanorum]